MSKPLNLTDMLWQKSEGRAERAQEKSKLARPAAQRPRAEFMPEAPSAANSDRADRADRTHKAGPKPFADRVKESQDRLSRKDHTFFKDQRPAVRDAHAARAEARRPEAHRAEGGPDSARPEAKARDAREEGNTEVTHGRHGNARSEAVHARNQARKAAHDETAQAPAGTWTPGESRPISLEAAGTAAGASGGWEDADLEGGAMDFDALQARLAELGIEATPEQLRDPAFLAEMLWMIDGIPMSLPLFPEALPSEGEALSAAPIDAAGAAGTAAAASASGALSAEAALAAGLQGGTEAGIEATGSEAAKAAPVPVDAFDWTTVEEPEREEIAALLREKLGALADKPEFKGGPAAAPLSPALGAPGPADSLHVARGEARLELSLPKADVALADPDRLRVLQAAGLTGPQAADVNALRVDAGFEDLDLEAPDAASDRDPMAPVVSAEAKGGKQEGGLPDLLGRNPGQAAETAGLRAGETAAPKDIAAPAFQSSLDHVRASEARPSQAKEASLPMAQAHEQTVLAQIARKMSALGLRGTEEIRIQLEPEHLGRVRIALEMREGGLTARIAVENDSVRQVVDANMAGLRTSLEDQGIKVQGMEVSVEHKHASLFNPDGSNAREFFRQRGQGGSSEGPMEGASDDSAESDTGRRMGYNTLEFIA